MLRKIGTLRYFLSAILLIQTVMSGYCFTQEKPSTNTSAPSQRTDLVNALIAQLAGDKDALDWNERVALAARLCKIEWNVDNRRARSLCEEAVQDLSRVPQNEEEETRQNRRAMTNFTLRVIAGLDPEYNDRLRSTLESLASPAQRRLELTPAEVTADPVRASKLISSAAETGPLDRGALRGLLQLSAVSPDRAEPIFQSILVRAKGYSDLATVAQVFVQTSPSPMASPNAWRDRVLQLITTKLLDTAGLPMDDSYCKSELPYELFRIRDLLPQEAAIQSQARSSACRPVKESPAETLPNPRLLKSSDDWLRAASSIQNPFQRGNYKLNGARVAESDEQDADKAISILLSFSEEEKKAVSGTFQRLQRLLVPVALKAFQVDPDRGRAYVDKLPREKRLIVDVDVAQRLHQKKHPSLRIVLDHAFESLRGASCDDPTTYLRLANLELAASPDRALQSLSEILGALERWKQKKDFGPDDLFAFPLDRNVAPLELSPVLQTYDPQALLAIARNIRKASLRVSYELTLVGMMREAPSGLAGQVPR